MVVLQDQVNAQQGQMNEATCLLYGKQNAEERPPKEHLEVMFISFTRASFLHSIGCLPLIKPLCCYSVN